MKFDPKKTIFIIDGSSILYRAYYGIRPMHTSKGEAVQAVFSFCRMIKKLINDFNPQHIALVWDSPGKTTRHEMYEEYKATRQAPPSDIFDQKERILEFAELIDLVNVAEKGIEADDIMYSIAKERIKAGDKVVFITSDKDMQQAISENLVVFDPFKDIVIDEKKFKELRGFPVEKLPFYFSLLGDASDNIPGVRGVGKKGATELVQQFDSLDDLYNNLDAVKKPRTRNALEVGQDNAFLSRDLFLLQYHPSGVGKKDLAFDADNWSNAIPLFQELEFKSLLRGVGKAFKEVQAATVEEKIKNIKKYKLNTVVTKEDLDDLCAQLKKSKAFGFDTETTGVRALQDELVGMSFSVKEGEAWYVPCRHKTGEQQLKCDEIITVLKPILEDPKIEKYLHNTKFDQLVMHHAGVDIQGITFDTMIAASLLIKDGERISLKKLSIRYFDEGMLTYDEVVKSKKLKNFSYVPLEPATLYAAMDAHQTLRLKKVLEKELKQEKLYKLYEQLEMPLSQVLVEMELRGIACDAKILEKIGIRVTELLGRIHGEIVDNVSEKFKDINLNSPKQVEQLLFYELKLPPQKKSAKRTGYSTDQEVLQALAEMHPVPMLILKYRELYKLKSTYIDALPNYINPETGRVHTTFSQTRVATGRLSSFEPNLQNVPASGYGIEIRKAFKPKKGNVFLSADYSQIELRILAHISKDKNLVDAFLKGHDIHAETAARLFEMKLDKVSHEQRQVGKRINFSILYGLTPYGLSKDLGISFSDAKKYIDTYFEQYPAVSTWMDKVIAFTKKNGYTVTLGGRRRYVPGIYEKNKNLYEEARRVAINTVAQGTAAEIMKMGMLKLDEALKKKKLNAQMLLQIHDELLISVAEDQKEEVEKVVKKVLESVVKWQVPLAVTTRFGKDWKEVTK